MSAWSFPGGTCPIAIQGLIEKCLNFDPDRRPANFAEVINILNGYQRLVIDDSKKRSTSKTRSDSDHLRKKKSPSKKSRIKISRSKSRPADKADRSANDKAEKVIDIAANIWQAMTGCRRKEIKWGIPGWSR